MSGENSDLKTCSRCRCTILLKYFKKNRKGQYFKTCNNCRIKHHDESNNESNDIIECACCESCAQKFADLNKEQIKTIDSNDIIKARNAFIKSWIDKGMKYKGKVNPDMVDYPDNITKLKGDEILIEYHKFSVPDCPYEMITRWRLREDD
jgi:hypothetical protein